MHHVVVPFLVLLAPAPQAVSPVFAEPARLVAEAASPRLQPLPLTDGREIERAAPPPSLVPKLPSRIAFTVAAFGRPVTIAPHKPAGQGLCVDVEITF
jgi:hypothetical protein